MVRPPVLAVAALVLSHAACGGIAVVTDEIGDGGGDGAPGDGADDAPPQATLLFVDDEAACGRAAPPEEAASRLEPVAAGDALHVVELAFADECTGAGGQHILARTVEGSRELWLGAHACRFFDDALVDGTIRHGVALAAQTAALFQTQEGVCIAFPGETAALISDQTVHAIAVFASLDDAERFAAALSE